MLELRGVSKSFGAFVALNDVSFSVGGGEIVGLLGENGAGKSTLLRLIGGEIAPGAGEMRWKNEPVSRHSPGAARKLGIGVVHQHFMLAPALSVAENLALHANASFRFDAREWEKRVEEWGARLGWRVEGRKRVAALGVGERQRVEILKALFARDDGETADLLLLDEPTANLTPPETIELFDTLRGLRNEGRALVFVSHKLNEVMALCDRVVVLRRGEIVGERKIEDTNATELATLMVGRAPTTSTPQTAPPQNEIGLQIENLSCGVLRDFSLSVRRGEIVGLAGVDGNGQAELAGVLSNIMKPESGGFEFSSPDSALAVIPPDRRTTGLIAAFNLVENLALHPALRSRCRHRFNFDWKLAATTTRGLMERFDVRAPAAKEYCFAGQLSGGNQQKLIIARALSFPHAAVLAVDPTRGLDVAAARFVHDELRAAAFSGAAVLLVSTDLDEVLALSDRIGVLYEGRLLPAEKLLPANASRETLGALMGGATIAARGVRV